MIIIINTPRPELLSLPGLLQILWDQELFLHVKQFSPSEGDGKSFNQTINSEFLIAGTKTFGDFNGKLILGSQLIANSMKIQAMSATALTIPDFYNISNRIGTPTVTQYTNNQGFSEYLVI